MTGSLSAARAALQSIKQNHQNLDVTDGISLLSLKHHLLLSYLQSLVLVAARRVVGDSLGERSPPGHPFGAKERDARGSHAGDLVDSMIENRIVLEKVEVLESKMRYQIEKLVRIADEPAQTKTVTDDPLAFRPNPMALMTDTTPDEPSTSLKPKSRYTEDDAMAEDGIYRPPRLAPVPYVEKSKNKERAKRAPIPSALATLAADPSQPFAESTSGLGGAPALASGRAQYLQRLKDFEEANFTRVIMKKSDAKRRARDEEDLALGGDLGGSGGRGGRRRAGGLEDEFGEVLRSVSRVTARDGRGQGDGYEELRQRSKKKDVLERSRENGKRRGNMSDDDEPIDAPRFKKKSRFEQETKVAKKKLLKR
ncbi:hypothetical protein BDN70DRAFT_798866 [Pholiota conissans]|uniref:Neuroguidin n=1 Tax=Pholiota conissans TaxID=109636 RepID=A0A9P5ZAJ9_9AGAR|nr:hypothetical protein BDN70DRAFT_798866 [Pholiota conissans]